MEMKTLSRLETLVGLQESVKIYVPSTLNVDIAIDAKKFIERVEYELSNMFGGCTSYETFGSYVSDSGKLVREAVTVVNSFSTKIENEQMEMVIQICEWLKMEMSQECVSLEVNGRLYFI
jgi:hypothetical protein